MHLERITINPQQCGGRPCIWGLRIRVQNILELLTAGVTTTEILEDYPYLEPEDIAASLHYAAQQVPMTQLLSGYALSTAEGRYCLMALPA